jgi:hypothetical protein
MPGMKYRPPMHTDKHRWFDPLAAKLIPDPQSPIPDPFVVKAHIHHTEFPWRAILLPGEKN